MNRAERRRQARARRVTDVFAAELKVCHCADRAEPHTHIAAPAELVPELLRWAAEEGFTEPELVEPRALVSKCDK